MRININDTNKIKHALMDANRTSPKKGDDIHLLTNPETLRIIAASAEKQMASAGLALNEMTGVDIRYSSGGPELDGLYQTVTAITLSRTENSWVLAEAEYKTRDREFCGKTEFVLTSEQKDIYSA